MRQTGSSRYANITSTLALVLALGGTGAYAAATIGSAQIVNGSIKSIDIKNGGVKAVDLAPGSVTGATVRNGTLESADFKPGQLPQGPPGPQGLQGPQGEPGESLAKRFAEIQPGATPSVARGTGVAGVTWEGSYYKVTFDADVSNCVPLGTATGDSGNNVDARVNVVRRATSPTEYNVMTFNAAGANVNTLWFSVAALCA